MRSGLAGGLVAPSPELEEEEEELCSPELLVAASPVSALDELLVVWEVAPPPELLQPPRMLVIAAVQPMNSIVRMKVSVSVTSVCLQARMHAPHRPRPFLLDRAMDVPSGVWRSRVTVTA